MTEELTRAARTARTSRKQTTRAMAAFTKPRAPDRGARLARKVTAERMALAGADQVKRAAKSR